MLQHRGRTGSSRAVLWNSQLGYLFKTTVGVRQGCLLSPILFNLFLEKIMQKTSHNHHISCSIGKRPVDNPRLANDIHLMGGSNFRTSSTDSLKESETARGTGISTEKSKIMTNSRSNIFADISMNGQRLKEVTSLKYLEQSCARMTPAQQRSALELPQQWQQQPG